MHFECMVVNVLLIDEEASRLRAMLMDNVHEAAGFSARCLFQFAKDLQQLRLLYLDLPST